MKKSIRFLDANLLRGLACILMLCDHMWATIIPGNEWMTWVGRLAFPIFAFQIAEGYLHTSNFRNYAVRLLLFGLISEIPFDLVYGSTIFYPFHQNVMFTLLFGLLAIKALDNARQKRTGKAWIAGILLAALCCLAASVIFTDYGALGVATVIMFYLCRDFRFAWAAQLALMILFNLVLFTGEYIPLTGNMSGSLLCEYVLSQKQANGKIPADGQVVKSIVTTNLVDAVAKNYGAELIEVLTGFKWIGKQVLKNEQEGKGTYLFGMEESYGCLIGTYARDKDAISATAALCEAAAYYKEKGMTLWDAMVEMYEKYGYYKDEVKSIGLKGIEGLAKIQEIMEYFRAHTPSDFAGHKVLAVRDYKADTVKDLATGEVKPTGLPSSNVLYYELEDNAWLCVRPSGTEPKIKFYYGVKGTSLEDAAAKSEKVGESVMAIVNGLL